jgi:hypoxanthine phosphoribosyltransferase
MVGAMQCQVRSVLYCLLQHSSKVKQVTKKLYLDAQQLLEDSFSLAAQVYQSGFRPSFIVAVWRGGAPMGIAMQELLAFKGIESDHIAIRTSSYHDIDQQDRTVQVFSLSYLVRKISASDRLLIVDDVYDTGRSIDAIIDRLQQLTRRNMPTDVRIAVPYYKPTRNQTKRVPDYYLHETEQWLKFPHSLEGLTPEEVRKYRPELANILSKAVSSPFNK